MKIRAHESFYMRKGWLHKGVRNIIANNRVFTDKDINSCDILGIGTNMVKSLRYWICATQIAEEQNNSAGQKILKITDFGNLIDDNDPYYEELGTNFLIHYKLATNKNWATAWYWLFNEYEGSTIDKDIFASDLNGYIKYSLQEKESKVLDDEFNCIIKTYITVDKDEDPEEIKICPLTELGLVQLVDKKTREIRKTSPSIDDIHPLVAYAIISDNAVENEGEEIIYRDEIRIDEICYAKNNLGKILNLNRTTIIGILDRLSKMGYITISRTAGLDVIKIVKRLSFLECVNKYYRLLNGEAAI